MSTVIVLSFQAHWREQYGVSHGIREFPILVDSADSLNITDAALACTVMAGLTGTRLETDSVQVTTVEWEVYKATHCPHTALDDCMDAYVREQCREILDLQRDV